ncbi:MAG: M23 family metallopeptidase [Deltaproteobacteria bacterium]|nr:M23 family metallopeptidase [Deltaproteobacteria bacterium]
MIRSSLVVVLLGMVLLGGCDRARPVDAPAATIGNAPPPPAAVPEPPPPPPEVFDIRAGRIGKNKTLSSSLIDLGIAGDDLKQVLAALKDVYNFRKARVGDQIRVSRKEGQLRTVEIRSSAIDEWLVERGPSGLTAAKRKVEMETRRVSVDLAVRSSLWDAMSEAGEDPELAVDIADVLAWDIDFYRDVRKGDRIRVVVDKVFAHGRLLRYGDIYGVRYEGAAVGSKRLLRYTTLAGETSYFDEKGTSAKKPFLKSPLKYVHITSRYGGRKHPLAGYYQNHLGVDFAAAVGTPVWAVGDGVVTRLVYGDRGGGNFLFLRHSNGYETGYLHLSRFAEGLKVGSRVAQKQVVAYTGNTGTSTGPHLHYALKRGGHYMNPMALKMPRSEPLSKNELPRFQETTATLSALLEAQLVATLVARPGEDGNGEAEPR